MVNNFLTQVMHIIKLVRVRVRAPQPHSARLEDLRQAAARAPRRTVITRGVIPAGQVEAQAEAEVAAAEAEAMVRRRRKSSRVLSGTMRHILAASWMSDR